MKAIAKFDPSRGAWTQYAKQYILDEMNRNVVSVRHGFTQLGDRWGNKRLPKGVVRQMYRIKAATGKHATAAELGISEAQLASYRERAITHDYAESFDNIHGGMSFESKSPTQSHTYEALLLAATLPHEEILTPAVWRALGTLTPQEVRVLLALVMDEKPVNEVAKAEGHLENWARETCRKALRKIREALNA